MDKNKLFEAVNMIDDDLIKEAEITPEKLICSDDDNAAVTVSGVETYKRPRWSRFAAVAAVLALAVGIGAAGKIMLKNRAVIPDKGAEDTDIVGTDDTEIMTKESSNKQGAGAENTSSKSESTSENDKEKKTDSSEENVKSTEVSTVNDGTKAPKEATQTVIDSKTGTSASQKPVRTLAVTTKTSKRTETAETNKISPTTTGISYTPRKDDNMDVFARLNELFYSEQNGGGLAEYVLNTKGDTEIFTFNFSEKWVCRNGSASNPVWKKAVLPDDIISYLKAHGSELGMYAASYSVPTPMQNYSFNAQYIRTNGGEYSGYHSGYPRVKVITSRAELDSYIVANKESYDFKNGCGSSASFNDATAKYDDNWFSSHKLAMVLMSESSGSNRHRVVNVGGMEITIERIIPNVGTCDMAEWHILIELDKAAYITNDVRVNTYVTNAE